MINKKMAAILGMDVPDDEVLVQEIVPVEPHELIMVDNPDLPPMYDIDRKLLQAEKQLEEVIQFTLGYQKTLFSEVASVDPKYRSRYVEVANGTLGIALDAIKVKIKTQENHRKQRLEEAEFISPRTNKKAGEGVTNNFFVGRVDRICRSPIASRWFSNRWRDRAQLVDDHQCLALALFGVNISEGKSHETIPRTPGRTGRRLRIQALLRGEHPRS